MAKGIVLYTDGTHEDKVFKQLSQYQTAVDGLIESVRMHDYYGAEVCNAYVNEEGILLNLPINPVASALSFMFGNRGQMVGNMIIVGNSDDDGNDTDIPDDIFAFIKRVSGNREILAAEYV
jgi:hypothetical protein